MTDPFRQRLQDALAAQYAIDEEIVGGGMSRVFAATERALGRKVVVKVLPPELAAGVNRERFQREIQLAAQLQHPHIVPLLSAGESGDLLWYTMPFIEGESLRTAISARGKLPVRDVVRIVHDVVEALEYAHRRGVIHRDIKPGNILMLGSHALVTDFGVAKAISAALPTSGMTSAGMAIGTPAYMAPEQLAADPTADHRVDLYAVGLLAYELLTGESPFTGTSPQETMARQLTRVPDPLAIVRPEVPADLSAVLMRCLEKLPEDRPKSAGQLLEMLDGVSTPRGGLFADGTSGESARRAPAATPAGASSMRIVLIAMGVVAVGGAVAIGLLRSRETATALVVGPDAAAPGVAVDLARTPPQPDTVRVPAVLTRADSLAIADAVRKRFTEKDASAAAASGTGRAGGSVAAASSAPAAARAPQAGVVVVTPSIPDSLGPEYRKALQDSMMKMAEAIRAARGIDVRALERLGEMGRVVTVPPSAPPGPEEAEVMAARRRVLVLDFQNGTGNPEMASVGAALADSIRAALRKRGLEPVIVPREAYGASRGVASLARQMGIGTIVAGVYQPMGDSLVVRVQIVDAVFSRNAAVIPMHHLPPAAPLAGAGGLAERVARGVERTLPGRGAETRYRFETRPRPEGQAPPPAKPPIP